MLALGPVAAKLLEEVSRWNMQGTQHEKTKHLSVANCCKSNRCCRCSSKEWLKSWWCLIAIYLFYLVHFSIPAFLQGAHALYMILPRDFTTVRWIVLRGRSDWPKIPQWALWRSVILNLDPPFLNVWTHVAENVFIWNSCVMLDHLIHIRTIKLPFKAEDIKWWIHIYKPSLCSAL